MSWLEEARSIDILNFAILHRFDYGYPPTPPQAGFTVLVSILTYWSLLCDRRELLIPLAPSSKGCVGKDVIESPSSRDDVTESNQSATAVCPPSRARDEGVSPENVAASGLALWFTRS